MRLSNEQIAIIEYCYPHTDMMWASTIIAMILKCDFRDAKSTWENVRDEVHRIRCEQNIKNASEADDFNNAY